MREHAIAWDSELCVLEASTPQALLAKAERLLTRIETGSADGLRLQDVAFSLADGLRPADTKSRVLRLAIVASSIDDLATKLKRGIEKLADPTCKQIRETAGIFFAAEPLAPEGKVAFLFPGEGSPYVNMLADLCVILPDVREAFEEADRLHHEQGKALVPSDFVFPRGGARESREWVQDQLQTLEGAISSVLTADAALLRVMEGLGVQPDAVVGHSAGEQAALLAAGVYRDAVEGMSSALFEIEAREDLRKEIDSAVMLALGTGKDDAEALIRENGLAAQVAVDNCPHQVIVVLAEENEAGFLKAASSRGIIVERMGFDRPYHTPGFEPFSRRLREVLKGTKLHSPSVPIYSCMTAAPFDGDAKAIADLIAGQWSHPVEFRETIEAMYADGVRLFVEVGPRNNLTAFVEDCLRGKPHCAVAANNHQRAGITQLNHMAGLLLAQGVPVRLDYLQKHRPARLIPLDPGEGLVVSPQTRSGVAIATAAPEMRLPPDFALASGAVSLGLASDPPTGQHDGGSVQSSSSSEHPANGAQPLQPMVSAPYQSVPGVLPQAAAVQSSDLASIAHGFLQTMDRFLQVQNQVMQAYFDATKGVSSGQAGPSAFAPLPAMPQVNAAAWPVETPAVQSPAYEAPAPVASFEPAGAGEIAPDVAAQNADFPPEQAALSLADSLPGLLKQIVSDRTGYPLDIIDVNADLEADLGIDSIKRVEILGTLRQSAPGIDEVNLELLTPQRTLKQIVDVIIEAVGVPAAASAPGDRPGPEPDSEPPVLWGKVVRYTPGAEIVVERTFDPEKDVWLRDHVLGREVSSVDPDLLGLPVMPFALGIELMAQAAATLKPGDVVVRIEGPRANRWVAFERGSQTIQVRAHLLEHDGSRVWAELRNLTEENATGSPMSPASEATLVMAQAFPDPPAPVVPADADGKLKRLKTGRFYDDLLFHGPSWQVLKSIESCGPGGARATVATRRTPAFEGIGAGGWVLDPVVLDGGAQVMGCWALENLTEGTAMLPLSAESIELYGPAPEPGDVLSCVLQPGDMSQELARADFDLISSGRVSMRVRGWAERRFYLPEPMSFISTTGALGNVGEAVALDELPQELQASSEARSFGVDAMENAAFMGRVWALRILSRRERERPDWRNGAMSDLDRLAGLHVAKEATRVLMERTAGVDISLADIELEPDGEAGFKAKGAWSTDATGEATVWLAQENGRSVALATLEPASFYEPLAFVRGLIGKAAKAKVAADRGRSRAEDALK